MSMPKNWTPHSVPRTNESIIFRHNVTHGIFRKHVLSAEKITNEFVELTNYNDKGVETGHWKILLSDLSDIIPINSRNIGSGMHQTVSYGRYGTRTYIGTSNFTSSQVSDIAFLVNGTTAILFKGINDARGIIALTKAARKALVDSNITDGLDWLNRGAN
jgi:hypothetical protein